MTKDMIFRVWVMTSTYMLTSALSTCICIEFTSILLLTSMILYEMDRFCWSTLATALLGIHFSWCKQCSLNHMDCYTRLDWAELLELDSGV